MEEISKINIKEFKKNPDGSWVSIDNIDINTRSNKVIRIAPGNIFKQGVLRWGMDIAKTLDEISSNPALFESANAKKPKS
ncbi:MAG: hypothetical protein V1874_10310 [Spirochaetota bacterium]